ncbi:3-oxoacyl-ACP reductase [Erythrobacter sp. Dej080120_24]|uniref:SDR family NAD(P)-dependent oxidoreductase n=1 Tax=Erythrobacter sp. Dej080120_24 TaxID=3024837 RepID=UPI0029213E30|nr:3-oxoacyl-ACP reductase [Erythrobacter sp. Dej080120_24]
MANARDLAGRTIVVTGASSGIGARFGEVLAARGARVALAARRLDRLEALTDTIKANGGEAMAVEMDVTDEASVIAAFDAVDEQFGRIDTVIANAGRDAKGSCLELTLEEFDSVMAVNLRGVFLTAREGARRMVTHLDPKARRGRIVLISSITSQMATPGLSAYSASKAAVNRMGKVMAKELARAGINLNMLLPGYIETDLTADSFQTESGKMFLASFPRRRLVEVEELDGLICYLCSDASSAVTGAEFTVDEGQSV